MTAPTSGGRVRRSVVKWRADNPAEERQLDHKAITVKELCTLYLNDLNAGLILGKGGRPKKPTTIGTDTGRISRHIIRLIGTRRVKDLARGRADGGPQRGFALAVAPFWRIMIMTISIL